MRHNPNSICHNAPVDSMGCAVSGDKSAAPNIFRFQTLVALMLSSQTKDAVTFDAIQQLRTKLTGGLTPASILAQPELAHECIKKTGFHNVKIGNLTRVASICLEHYNNDIPSEYKSLLALPGVGPKMANLTMQAAWGETIGIGVDTHVHRLANMLHWVNESSSEKTRIALQAILPPQYFSEINWSLVGFGQTICPSRGPKCTECALAQNLMCPSSNAKHQFRTQFDQQAQQYYVDHLSGISTPVSDLITNHFAKASRPLDAKLDGALLAKMREALVQISLQTNFNITPQRLEAFLTDQPPALPGESAGGLH